MVIQKYVFFCYQTNGRTNQLPFNRLEGNRLSICPLRLRIASRRVPIDLGCASVNRNAWGGDPESLGANRSANYPRDKSLFV